MKQLYYLKFFLLVITCMAMRNLAKSQNINLIDIDKYKNSHPQNNRYSAKNIFTYLKGYSYFTADDGVHGRELWKTNGTSYGTQLVKDINPGTGSSESGNYDIVQSGNKVFFAADGGPNGFGLWVSDGTSAGTNFLVDASNGAGALPGYLCDVNGILYFEVYYYNYNTYSYTNQIWKSDGTVAGTTMVTDLGPNGYNIQQLTNVNGKLFFTFYDFNNYPNQDLYVSDGTAAGTSIVESFYSQPLHLTSSNGLLYFIADDGTGSNVWISDGTTGGTHGVNSNGIYAYSTSDAYNTDTFAIIKNVLYFQGSTDANGNELCKYDESNPAAGITFVKDVVPGPNSSYPSFMTNVKGTLYFTIGPVGQDPELWKSDGTDAGTVLVKDINPGGENGYYGLTAANGKLLFVLGTNASGYELWRSDGTANGTNIVKDINPGNFSSFPGYLVYANGVVLFQANDGKEGYELWKSDGSGFGTTMIKDINHTASSSSYPYGFATLNNKIIFSAQDEKYGRELWSTDGTAGGTDLFKDIYPGTFDGNPSFITKVKNKIYFFGSDSTGTHLWKTDGTAAGTHPIFTALDNDPGSVQNVIAGDDIMYIYILNYNSYQAELWRSDGTPAGTFIVDASLPLYYDFNYTVVGNTIFFTNDDYGAQYGNELWKSDGTIAGTGIVQDINPGPNSSYPYGLYSFNGKVYFYAYSPNNPNGYDLYESDGTNKGTFILSSLPNVSYWGTFSQTNRKLLFPLFDYNSYGLVLYATDGTPAGTKPLKTISNPIYSIFNMSPLISGNRISYFVTYYTDYSTIYDAVIWKSDGTANGTVIVKDLPFSNYFYGSIYNMVTVKDNLYFEINDTLWQSDGTAKGTQPVKSSLLNGATSIGFLTNVNNELFFRAYTNNSGEELYVLNPSCNSGEIEMVKQDIISNDATFSARLLSNPVSDQLKIAINVKSGQEAKVVITDISGRILANDKQTLSPGVNTLTYSSSNWAQGIYLVNIITSEKFNTTLKALK